jgi:hypothetical protein
MSLTATAHSIPGTLRREVVIDGKHRLITDEPEHLGGDGSGPAPHELFPAPVRRAVEAGIEFVDTIAHRELRSAPPLVSAGGTS